jgi:phosphate transport system protein
LVTILRIAPELERSGDLATHIADLRAQRLATWLTPRAIDLLAEMGAIDGQMRGHAAAAFASGDAGAGDRLRGMDDEVDDLHVA